MTKLGIVLFLFLTGRIMAHMGFGQESGAIDIDAYQWRNRLLLVFAPSEENTRYRNFRRELRDQEDEIVDRDLLVFHIFESGESRVGNSSID